MQWPSVLFLFLFFLLLQPACRGGPRARLTGWTVSGERGLGQTNDGRAGLGREHACSSTYAYYGALSRALQATSAWADEKTWFGWAGRWKTMPKAASGGGWSGRGGGVV